MASQISHIVYAKKFLDKLEKGEMREDFFDNETIKRILTHRDKFLLGTVFPDIRRVAENLSRQDTHSAFASVDLNFEGLTVFQAGWKFHLYCDMRREEILNKYGFYSAQGDEKFWQSNKMLEDELLYDRYNNWEKLVNYFNNVPSVTLSLELSENDFKLWYAMLARYISEKPDERSMHLFIEKQSMFRKNSENIVTKVSELKKHERAVEILKKVVEEIV